MPYEIRNSSIKGRVSVSSPSGVKAKATTKEKAKKQVRLLNAIDHGWKPGKRN